MQIDRLLLAGVIMSLSFPTGASAQESPAFDIWPDGAPGAVGTEDSDIPTLTPYLPAKTAATGAAVIVCPGGGYGCLAPHEGEPIAQWLNSLGIAGFVLKYRHGPRYGHPAPLQDAARAIRTVRSRAGEWDIDPDRIGIIGFSAGGHLASTIGTHFDLGQPDSSDPIEHASSRPDLLILCYPVITMGRFTHEGSRQALLGESPTQDLVDLLSNENQVTPETPPTFLFHTTDDEAVHSHNSLLFAQALRVAEVEHELHLYQHGQHGVGLAQDDPVLSSWPERCADWLALHQFTASSRLSDKTSDTEN